MVLGWVDAPPIPWCSVARLLQSRTAALIVSQESNSLLGFNRAAPRPPTRKNREPSPGKIGGPPPGKYENPDFRIFEQFLDFWFFYGRFGPREGFHGLPRTRAIIFHPLMPQTDPPRPNSAPKQCFSYIFPTCFQTFSKKSPPIQILRPNL